MIPEFFAYREAIEAVMNSRKVAAQQSDGHPR